MENKKQFRTRFIHACHHKAVQVEAFLATSKQKAVEVGVSALKRMQPVQVQTKKCVPHGSKVCSSEIQHKSYADVVKSNASNHSTRFKTRDCTTNFPDCDQVTQNANTTVTDTNHNSKAIDVVHNVTA